MTRSVYTHNAWHAEAPYEIMIGERGDKTPYATSTWTGISNSFGDLGLSDRQLNGNKVERKRNIRASHKSLMSLMF